MSELASLLDELERSYRAGPWHGPSLEQILTDITAEEAVAKPFRQVHSIREIVLHIAGWQEVCQLRLRGMEVTEPPEGDFPEDLDWVAALARLRNSNERLLSVLSVLPEAALHATVAHKDYTVAFMLHGLVSHCVYHSGQISLLKRVLRSVAPAVE